ncbi:GNAT family N-acetyltransferase [Aquirufa regiilacus]|uniref:GNAT family N-acetyltransferase n=1 Tax=Aquirufa regiilacus TaxID=3024868 RepID=A0ABU3TTJ0_9BACT|nr:MULTISPECIES: GNAT family N-acetyltransferase [unclassified Aquirufa]MDT8886134.1 GNAT family N-acetyltransferase [Aquirufa sp. LEPPI-3A]MDU0809196.1 GNAT family N-acetyltransferase [Aquirufa sp. LEOWEIH-7C]
MSIREALLVDIPEMHRIRMAVKENVLTNPLAVQEADYVPFLSLPNKGWVCEIFDQIVGFSMVDVTGNEVWALFVDPSFEAQGVGGGLHDILVKWYFALGEEELILGTEVGTRAENFYRHKGWKASGQKSNGEIIFKMHRKDLHLSS